MRYRTLTGICITLALATACVPPNERGGTSDLSGTLNGSGSSAQEAAFAGWRSAFQRANPDVTVNYDPSGSGAGRELFLAGGVQFAGSDSALDEDELAASKKVCAGETAFNVPSYVSAIAVVYNLPGVDGLTLSADTLARIFSGDIKRWDDRAIQAENPDLDLPGVPLAAVHRADDSGTTKNFTDYLAVAASQAWPYEADGVWPLKGGEAAQGNSGVVDAVSKGEGTIGYADESQAQDLQIAAVLVGENAVEPSAESAAKIVAVSPREEGRAEGDIALDIARDTTEAGAYPIVLVSYVIACPSYAQDAELVRSFLSYLISAQGQQDSAATAGSAPLPTSITTDAATSVGAIRTR